jgi:hypothetical protein
MTLDLISIASLQGMIEADRQEFAAHQKAV